MRKVSVVAALALAASSLSAAPIEEVIKGASVSGSSFFRYISNSGRNDGGQGYIARLVADLNSGNIEGFTFNFGLFYHNGGIPAAVTKSDLAVGGSRADRSLGMNVAGNVFGLSTLYGKYAFESTKTAITGGKMKLATPISSAANDRAVGVMVTNSDIAGLTLAGAYFDSWAADNQYIGGFMGNIGKTNITKDGVTTTAGQLLNVGNNLAAVAVIGKLDAVNFQAWYFNIDKIANSVFGELSVGDTYQLKAQVAYTNMFHQVRAKLNGARTDALIFGGQADAGAKSRGLYTIQLSTKPMDGLFLKAGFVGSFGDGYGVALNNVASLSVGGKYWYDNFGNGRNGFSLFGQGGTVNSNIAVWYLGGSYKYSILKVGLDIAGVSGKNNYWMSAKDGKALGNGGNKSFTEITPSLDVSITKKATFSAYYSMIFGQVSMQRFWTQISYKF